MRVGDHAAMDSEIAGAHQPAKLFDGAALQTYAERELIARGARRPNHPLTSNPSEPVRAVVRARRLAREMNHQRPGVVGIHVDIRIADVKDRFGVAEFEVNAAGANRYIRRALVFMRPRAR